MLYQTRSFPRSLSYLLLLIAFLLLNGCAASSFIGYKMSPDYPKDKSETIELAGLSAPVSIYLDEAGVSHVEAQNEMDLLRAVGFTQSRSRFFGMDAMRRITRGRLSELVGDQSLMDSTTVGFDLSMRGWGFDKAVASDVAGLTDEQRKLIQAFTDGVNAALKMYPPLEYRLLRVEPEPWTIEDSFALGRLTAWSITHNYHQEATRLLLALNVGIDRAEEIYGNDYWHGNVTLPSKEFGVTLPPAIAPELRELLPAKPYQPWEEEQKVANLRLAADAAKATGASNSWVVSGEESASGKPMVASDPHMAHLMPSFFFPQHLKTPDLDVMGTTVPGLPYVLIGHNKHVAWAATSAVSDCIDLYIEKVNPENADQYLTPNGWKDFVKEEVVIRVLEDGELVDKVFTLRSSRHGAIMNDMYPNLFPKDAPPVAIKWDTEGVSKGIAALGVANRAKNVTELREAFYGVVTPAQSWSAADTNGTIAHFMSGKVPIRHNHRGTFPVPGWLDKYEWDGFLNPEELPWGESTSGHYAHANNLTIDPELGGNYYQIDSAPSYRVDRILEMLKEVPKHNKDSFAAIQTDVLSIRARRITPRIMEVLETMKDLTPAQAKAREILKSWNYVTDTDSAGAAIFFLTYRESIMEAVKDEMDKHAFEFFMSQRYSTNVADLWFDRPDHVVWDNRATEELETRSQAIKTAFTTSVTKLTEWQGEDPSAWRWGALHDIHIKHVFGSKKALAKTVNLPRAEVGGGLDTVWKSHFDLGHPKFPFRAMAGPVYRMIVDLNDMDHGWWVSDTGVSGWPLSPHYGDQHKLWLKGEYLPMIQNWDEIRSNAKGVLSLTPKQPEK